MVHNSSESSTNITERDFVEYMQRGDDFFKIELLRQAKSWYNKALQLKPETDRVKYQIAECDKMLAFENKVVKIVCVLAGVWILVYFIIFR
jgi:uncharacterized UPF0160 family protein